MTTTTPRKELLDRVHELMSIYLVDECPEDENWEDFDPHIDQLRTDVGDLLEAETQRITTMPIELRPFAIDIQFFSNGDFFAVETYDVEAIDWTAAKLAAFRLADDSVYDNDRIPDLTRRAIERSTGDPDAAP